MGTLSELIVPRKQEGRCRQFCLIIFKGYPKGYRTLFAQNASFKRMALNLGLPMDLANLDLVRALRQKLVTHQPIHAKIVTKGPILENVDVRR